MQVDHDAYHHRLPSSHLAPGTGTGRDLCSTYIQFDGTRNVIPQKSKAEDYLKASGLDYTIIRPGGLLNKDPEGRAYLTEDTPSMSWIRRADVAALTVQALDDPRAIGKIYHAFDPDRTRFWSIPMN